MELRKQKTYKGVYDLACRTLLGSDVEAQLVRAGVPYGRTERGLVASIPFFDETVTLSIPGFSFRGSKSAVVTLVTRIILLHYLNGASGAGLGPLSGRVPFEDLPAGRHYAPVFHKRAARPLESAFGMERHLFLEAGMSLGGRQEELGDASFTLFPLPMVPITFILWEADEEFPPAVKLLFDPAVTGYLSLEDIVVLSKLAGNRIIKAARIRSFEGEEF